MKNLPAPLLAPLRALLPALVLATLSQLAAAQGVWRCGADGRSYSDAPCAEGRGIELPQARPAADVEAARRQAAADQRLAEQLRRQRLDAEQAQRGSGMGAIGGGRPAAVSAQAPPATQPRAPKRPSTPAAGDTWRAVVPATRGRTG